MTLDQIAAELGISRERVRQIEVRALHKLRERLQQRFAEMGVSVEDVLALSERHGEHPLVVAMARVLA